MSENTPIIKLRIIHSSHEDDSSFANRLSSYLSAYQDVHHFTCSTKALHPGLPDHEDADSCGEHDIFLFILSHELIGLIKKVVDYKYLESLGGVKKDKSKYTHRILPLAFRPHNASNTILDKLLALPPDVKGNDIIGSIYLASSQSEEFTKSKWEEILYYHIIPFVTKKIDAYYHEFKLMNENERKYKKLVGETPNIEIAAQKYKKNLTEEAIRLKKIRFGLKNLENSEPLNGKTRYRYNYKLISITRSKASIKGTIAQKLEELKDSGHQKLIILMFDLNSLLSTDYRDYIKKVIENQEKYKALREELKDYIKSGKVIIPKLLQF
ncbi:MAG: hypothetical protein AAGG75_13015, partial [Bacteroidota bacterium]